MVDKTTVRAGAQLFDKVSNNSNKTAIMGLGIAAVGAIMTPTLGPEVGLPVADFGLGLSGFSLTTSTSADATSAAFKEIDAHAFGGSKKIANNQLNKAIINGTMGLLLEGLVPTKSLSGIQRYMNLTVKDATNIVTTQTIDNMIQLKKKNRISQ